MTQTAEQVEQRTGTLAPSTLWGLLLSTALVPLGSTMIAVALTAIGREFEAEPATLTQWLVNSYLLVGIVLQSPAGKLGDLWGARRTLMLGQVVFAVGAGLGFLGGSLAALVVARVLMAAGGALLVPATVALLRITTTEARRARVFGAFGASMALAAAVGPLLGGVLVDAFGWRSIFLANIPLLAFAAPLVRRIAEAPVRRAARVRFDWIGSVLLGAGLTAAVAGSRTFDTSTAGLFFIGGALLVVFVMWERRVPDPVLDPGLFRHIPFAAGGMVVALHNLVMYALLFQLPMWFGSLGSGTAEIGRVLLTMMFSMVICSPLGGRLSERLGARAVAVLGTTTALGGLLLLTRHDRLSEAPDAVLALILIGAGLGLASAPTQAAAVTAIDREHSGMAAGAISTMRYLGGVVGIGALGFVLRDVALGNGLAAADAHQAALRIFLGVMLLAVVPSALLPGTPPKLPPVVRRDPP